MGREKKKARGAAAPVVWRKISDEQHELGWQLFASNCDVGTITATVGITAAEYRVLLEKGDPTRGWEPYRTRQAKLTAEFRKREQEVSRNLALKGALMLDRECEIAAAAQDLAAAIIGRHMDRVRVASLVPETGQADDDDDWGDESPTPKKQGSPFAMPLGERETLKVLKTWADITKIGLARRSMFGGDVETTMDPLSQGRKKLPAPPIRSALQEAQEAAQAKGTDPVMEILGDTDDWTLEEIEHYEQTGEQPARLTHVTATGSGG